jgi:hypothetical protein
VSQPAAAAAAPRGKRAKSEQVGPLVSLDGKRVVGVDPERRNLASCSWKEEAGVAAFSRFTNKEYKEKRSASGKCERRAGGGGRENPASRRRWQRCQAPRRLARSR